MYDVIDGKTREVLSRGFLAPHHARAWIADSVKDNPRQLSFIKSGKQGKRSDSTKLDQAKTHKDVFIANAYVLKQKRAEESGIEFNLSFTAFRNMSKAKRCKFTGLELDSKSFTIDRIDNSKGYVSGNVAACHKAFNQLKSMVENPHNELTMDMAQKAFAKAGKLIREQNGK